VNVSTRPSVRAWVEVDLSAIVANAQAVLRANPGARLLPMVKANAYGLGVERVVGALAALDPWGFGVATVEEGRALRGLGVERPIVVCTPVRIAELPACRDADLRPVLDDVASIDAWDGPYHLEIDTGMGRGGIRWNDPEAIRCAMRSPPEGVFTHFHSADTNAASVDKQVDRLRNVLAELPAPPLIHAANSAGAFRGVTDFDLVRPGIFLYGGRIGEGQPEPRPVVSVRSRVVSIRRLQRGDTVSYGATWSAPSATTIATLGIGYADGVPRSCGGKASVWHAGKRRPIVGRVTMDMTMINMGDDDAPVQRGDVVTLIGRDGDGETTIDQFAEWAGTISYEIIAGLGARLDREYSRS